MTSRDTGSAALELALLTPALLTLLALLVVVGRTQVAAQAVEEAARDAAREASIARSATAAQTQAHTAATQTLHEQGLQCLSLTVTLDTAGFGQPAGEPAQVEATVACQVRLADLGLPGLESSHLVQASFHSPLDTFREREP